MLKSLKSKVFSLSPPTLLIVLNFFLFGAATIYQGNTSGFGIDFVDVIKLYTLPFLISLLALLGIGIFLSKKYLSLYISLIFASGLLLWLQGNIMVWEYGVFDGDGIEWSKYSWQGWTDTGLWLILLTGAIIFHKKILKISSFASLALILLQSIFLISTYFPAPNTWSSNFSLTEKHEFPETLFNYSSSFNIVHIILDSFQTDVFQEIVEENNLTSDLDGFILFRENMGVAPNTFLSIPAIFSGEAYQGKIDEKSYVNKALSEKGFQNILFNNGYDVNLVPGITMPGKNYTSYYRISGSYGGSKREKEISDAATLMDMIMFRHLPHFLKKKIYNNQNWIFQTLTTKKKSGNFRYKDFFQDYIDSVQIKSSLPAYHYIHLLPPHPPYVTDKNCKYTGGVLPNTRNSYKTEARCVLNLFIHFIKKLKSLGIYDASMIILQADTGRGFRPANIKHDIPPDNGTMRSIGYSLALLAIKPPDKKGALTISHAKTIHTDIPPTVMNMAGLKHNYKGIPVFELDPSKKRTRWFDNSFKVTGSVYDYQSWKKVSNLSVSKKVVAQPYQWGSAIQFGLLGNAKPYQTKGWSYLEDGFVWTVRQNALLTLPITTAPSSPVILKAKLRSFLAEGKIDKQTVHVLINGQKAGTWLINKPGFQDQSLIIPARLFTDSTRLVIIFNTPDATSPADAGYINDRRTLGIAVHSIVLSELIPYQWGLEIQFGKKGNAQPYQSKGWGGPENALTWSIGKNATLTIPIDMVPKSSITLKANLMAFLYPNKVNEQKVDVLVNGHMVGTWVISKPGFHEQTLIIPKKFLKGSNRMVITFNTPDAASPAQLGISSDKRVLGIAMRTIKFTE